VAIIEIMSKIKLSSFPVATRWGTWIRFCNYVCLHFEKIKEFAESMLEEDNESIGHLLRYINEPSVIFELSGIFELRILPVTIEKLEGRNLTIDEVKSLIEEVRECLPAQFKRKLEQSLAKNPSYERIFSVNDPTSIFRYKYTLLTSGEVERCFSQLKHILNDSRTKL